jgi:hypothetical protein
MVTPKFSESFKKSVIVRYLNRGSIPVSSILEDIGISSPTLYRWKSDYAKEPFMKDKGKSPHDRSPKEKLDSLIEYEALPVGKRGIFLRKKGLHFEHLEAWRKQIEETLRPEKKQSQRLERANDRRKIKELEKDLRRKDRALAETSALLILKKKADLLWGTKEDA